MYNLIEKKKRGYALTKDEIQYIVDNYTNGKIPDYQMSAFLMAVYFSGMNSQETYELTMAMAHSGELMKVDDIKGVKIDKHSTGGVGDKVTLILGPLVAACGVPVAKMSGRGLGHTGGTIDKLESIEGFNTSISKEQFIANVNNIGIAIAGQTANLAPADKKIYALRDVTATVDNISLIASSVMSKKLASGADGIVLDVKCGTGAFMKNEADAVKLAECMVDIGNKAGRTTVALITDMNQPLGYAVGNALEVKEAIEVLKGKGPEDLRTLVVELGARMVLAAGIIDEDIYGIKDGNYEKAKKIIEDAIIDGSGFKKLKELVKAQGGNVAFIDNPELLPQASIVREIIYQGKQSYVSQIEAEAIGKASLVLGGGRRTKESIIDMAVGIILNKKIGDRADTGEVIGYIHGNDENAVKEAMDIVLKAYEFSDKPVDKPILIKQVVFQDVL